VRRYPRVGAVALAGKPRSMSDQDEPRTIPSLRDTGEAARQTASPDTGYPAGDTEPYDGLTGDEGRVNADATPDIADDAEHGRTESPAE
jgi:hypothetical protein